MPTRPFLCQTQATHVVMSDMHAQNISAKLEQKTGRP